MNYEVLLMEQGTLFLLLMMQMSMSRRAADARVWNYGALRALHMEWNANICVEEHKYWPQVLH